MNSDFKQEKPGKRRGGFAWARGQCLSPGKDLVCDKGKGRASPNLISTAPRIWPFP